MKIISAKEKSMWHEQPQPFGLADQILGGIADYDFDLDAVKFYDDAVKDEIVSGIVDLRKLRSICSKPHLWSSLHRMKDLAVRAEEPIKRDQAVWELTAVDGAGAVDTLIASIRTAPTVELTTSALLALQKVAHHSPAKVAAFLEDLATDRNTEVAEWARLHLQEMVAGLPGGRDRLGEAVSQRDFVYEPGNPFDVTMPLVFHCHAYTKVGPVHLHSVISPAWFSLIFGQAMACVRHETFLTNLILEKQVSGLHTDGSPHYEHFPFSGTTDHLAPRVFRHNYWAHLYRPYYTSGRTEVVTPRKPVIRDMPMTFCRLACTYTPERYQVTGGPTPESVRGLFFGYGHISPTVLLRNQFKIRAGDFQLSSKINPATGNPANTYFYGTFFGKLSDWDGDGKLDINLRPVHCDTAGNLDYRGDGTMERDPVCPDDWAVCGNRTAEWATRP
jgi:hypothetical protein